MTTPTDIQYALMAGASYISNRPDKDVIIKDNIIHLLYLNKSSSSLLAEKSCIFSFSQRTYMTPTMKAITEMNV